MAEKILIIQEKMIGDVLTTSTLFEAIKNEKPNAELHFLVQNHTTAVLESNPFIDRIIISNKSENLVGALKAEAYDVVIDVYSKLRSALLAKKLGVKKRFGYSKWFGPLLYSQQFPLATQSEHGIALALENRFSLLKPIIKNIDYSILPKIYLSQAELDRIEKRLETFDFEAKKPLYMLNVLGSSKDKTYPPKAMAQLIDDIVALQPEAQLLFNYIPNQLEQAREIFDACQLETQYRIRLDFYGESLREFIVLTSFCTALIGNEGGAIHMAKALDVPTFAIFSPWIRTDDWNVNMENKSHRSVHLKDYKPELYETYNQKKFKKQQAELYQHFSPEVIKNDLLDFLKGL